MIQERSRTDPKPKLGNLDKIVAVIVLVAHLAIHAPFLMTEYFGESDCAQIANDSIKAAYNGVFQDLEYTVYSSPLYDGLLQRAIQSGLLPPAQVPRWLALIGLAASAAATVATYFFALRLFHSTLAGVGAALMLQLVPPFWFSSIYGFPSILSIAFLMSAVLLFDLFLARDRGPTKLILLLFCLVSYLLAVLAKLDALLTSAIFVLPIVRAKLTLKSKVLYVLALGAVSILTYLAFLGYADSLLEGTHFTRSWSGHNTAYPSHTETLFSKKNGVIIARAVGILSLPTALVGVALIGWRREHRAAVLWLSLAALPLVVLWSSKPANSARHILFPSIFLALLLALPLAMRAWKKWAWAGLLCVVCVANYLYFAPSSDSAYLTSGRLLASTRLLREKAKTLSEYGQTIAQLPYPKIAVIGHCNYHAYYRNQVLSSDTLEYVSHMSSGLATAWGKTQALEMKRRDGVEQRSFLFQCTGPDLESLIHEGYFLIVDEAELANELQGKPELAGKWMSLTLRPSLDRIAQGDAK
jgi:hypothetical protein